MGKYYIFNNLWGEAEGTGSQCVWNGVLDGDTIGYGTNWTWTGGQYDVKSYSSIVLGWQWGWKLQNTGLPVQLSAGTDIQSTWTFTITEYTENYIDVGYDCWFHNISDPESETPTTEMMIWLYYNGMTAPYGTYLGTYTLADTTWSLYVAWVTTHYEYVFFRLETTTSQSLNLKDFTDVLVNEGYFNSSLYLTSIEIGPECYTGDGEMVTSAYSVTIG
jgi:hypothetical protein